MLTEDQIKEKIARMVSEGESPDDVSIELLRDALIKLTKVYEALQNLADKFKIAA